jgi:hypothetical protein
MQISIDTILRALIQEITHPLALKVNQMNSKILELTHAIATNTQVVQAAVANEASLKSKLDAALAANATLAEQNAALAAQLGAAQSAGLSAEDTGALDGVASALAANNQALADANAINSPSN